jgi:hypothetical protein
MFKERQILQQRADHSGSRRWEDLVVHRVRSRLRSSGLRNVSHCVPPWLVFPGIVTDILARFQHTSVISMSPQSLTLVPFTEFRVNDDFTESMCTDTWEPWNTVVVTDKEAKGLESLPPQSRERCAAFAGTEAAGKCAEAWRQLHHT